LQMLYSNQRMEAYMLTIYFIHRKCANIMLSHHLQLKVQCDFTYATKGFFSCKVDCKLFLVTNWHSFTSVLIQHDEQIHNPTNYDPWSP
jgi:hypothetical protein